MCKRGRYPFELVSSAGSATQARQQNGEETASEHYTEYRCGSRSKLVSYATNGEGGPLSGPASGIFLVASPGSCSAPFACGYGSTGTHMTPVCCDASCHKRNQQCSVLNPVGQLSCTWWDATVGDALDTHCEMIFKPKPSSRQQSSALSPAPDTKVYISRWQLVQEVLRAAPRMRFIAAVALLAACQAAYGQSPAVSFHHSGHIGTAFWSSVWHHSSH